MPNLELERNVGNVAIAGSSTILGISWLNNQFKAVAMHRGEVVGAWAHTSEDWSVEAFETQLREAVQKTGYRGANVSMVLAQPRLVSQTIEVPPVKDAGLKKILARQAQQQKVFTGEAAWSFEAALHNEDSRRIILHVFPRQLLNQLVDACLRNGLHLVSVVPATTVLQQQLRELPLEKGGVALLAAETGGSTTVVVGRNDGCILLARTLPGTWSEGGERLAMDVNLTLVFASQKYGVPIDHGVWLYGPSATERAAAMRLQKDLSVHASPVEHDAFYWAAQTLKLKPRLSTNFISPVLQKAHQRHVLAGTVMLLTVLVVLLSTAAAVFAFGMARKESTNQRMLEDRYKHLETQRTELRAAGQQLASESQFATAVLEDRWLSVPIWFLAYLSEAVPPQLVVTNLQVGRVEGFWAVKLSGVVQVAAKPNSTATSPNPVALLKARLADGPFHLKPVNLLPGAGAPALTEADQVHKQDFSNWLARLSVADAEKAAGEPESHFEIAGAMR